LKSLATKNTVIANLDYVASQVTCTGRPRTIILTETTDIPETIVLKRTHSDCGVHVLRPGDRGRTWAELSQSLTLIPEAMWLGQSYVSTLESGGEWRVFLIGGGLVYTVHTVYNKAKRVWKNKHVDEFLTLEEIEQVLFQSD
jgi:glutathione synthase/RimK-type ligase-like ATP-grasp enzyme